MEYKVLIIADQGLPDEALHGDDGPASHLQHAYSRIHTRVFALCLSL